ncbi:glycogen debranching protein [Leifsonia xyli subsp. cynodontis DSM 46306]|uniref:Glycosyl hydrolase family 13 catalytic domain-containing protein n=1 Tax=Leifsonia xyli subsp. cynodontis DSM 46306 TaxID=1389489 RepID=U3PCJ9_LEIXC|nr:glycogen debranching protein GlgX [Leifsonia xyli]AGW42477.1 glycogen debranching protein [Leifsonia xyli subsp. cynodontis DSM 46306]
MTDPLSSPYPLGVTLLSGGANVAVYSERADRVTVCVFGEDGSETRTELTDRTGHVFHGVVPGMAAGARYGLRVDGPWDPTGGQRFSPAKVLLDPHARAIVGAWDLSQADFGHQLRHPRRRDDTDGAGHVALGVATDPGFDWGDDRPPRIPLGETVIYEMHVKGFTKRMPGVPEELRGTYAGLANEAAIDYLKRLGVTAVELLPVHQFVQDSHLLEKGLRNYWGYNSIGFFAPHNEYAATGAIGQQVDEFKGMVKALHAAGIEVILDVVYNHTAEGNHLGPTLSLKGIDNPSYYRLVEGDERHYFDTTGTGNSVNVSHPAALQLILDSLRYWVEEVHVDGFRFDLATALTRQGGEASLHSAFLTLVQQDPTLKPVKLIAEPWDVAGYQLGGFPADWSEWNGRFRDDVRDFWRGTEGMLATLSQRVLGSPDLYEDSRRAPLSSVNFVTAHDGFTLADLTSYEQKRNEDNGEDNQDGESDNRSANYGAEGPTDDPGILAVRLRQRKNFLATVLLSAGVPMILGGDEIGRTQRGNNNAYCQDGEISWFDWAAADEELRAFTERLIRLRRTEPALRPEWYRRAPEAGGRDVVRILRADGEPFAAEDWEDPEARSIAFELRHEGADTFLLLLNAAANGVKFTLPATADGPWSLELSSDPGLERAGGESVIAGEISFALLRSSMRA